MKTRGDPLKGLIAVRFDTPVAMPEVSGLYRDPGQRAVCSNDLVISGSSLKGVIQHYFQSHTSGKLSRAFGFGDDTEDVAPLTVTKGRFLGQPVRIGNANFFAIIDDTLAFVASEMSGKTVQIRCGTLSYRSGPEIFPSDSVEFGLEREGDIPAKAGESVRVVCKATNATAPVLIVNAAAFDAINGKHSSWLTDVQISREDRGQMPRFVNSGFLRDGASFVAGFRLKLAESYATFEQICAAQVPFQVGRAAKGSGRGYMTFVIS